MLNFFMAGQPGYNYIPCMLFNTENPSSSVSSVKAAALLKDASHEVVAGKHDQKIIFLCDHASNLVPDHLDNLGLDEATFERHIAYDIGASELTRGLAAHFGTPAVLSNFSRLLIDPNRGIDDPTLIMRLSDGAIIPENAQLEETARGHRLENFYHPYHQAITDIIDQALSEELAPVLISIHSFTPAWKGHPRPWHAGILWDKDPRFAQPLISELRNQDDIVVGDNQPYKGALKGDCLHRHATQRGLAHGLVEVRQDLICDDDGVAEWVDRLVSAIQKAMKAKDLHKIIHYGSHSD